MIRPQPSVTLRARNAKLEARDREVASLLGVQFPGLNSQMILAVCRLVRLDSGQADPEYLREATRRRLETMFGRGSQPSPPPAPDSAAGDLQSLQWLGVACLFAVGCGLLLGLGKNPKAA